MKTLCLPCRTTAENMAVEMYDRLKNAGLKSVQRETVGNTDIVCGV